MSEEIFTKEDLADFVSKRRPKEDVLDVANWVGSDSEKFLKVWELVQHGTDREPEYASWLMFHCLEQDPSLLEPHQFDAYEVLLGDYHGGVKRALLKGLTHIDLSADLVPLMFDLSLTFIGDRNSEAAIRCHSIFLAWKIAEGTSEFENELYDTIHNNMPNGTAGFLNRGRKVLKWIEKSQAL